MCTRIKPLTSGENGMGASGGGLAGRRTKLLVAAVAAIAALVGLGVTACGKLAPGSSTGGSQPGAAVGSHGVVQNGVLLNGSVPSATARPASSVLATITVRAASTRPKYVRDRFGPAWADVDRNSCDTRDDVLHRDLTLVRVRQSDACIVTSGKLRDPYTARVIGFARGKDSASVQIDHVVPLGDAWYTGASSWSATKREDFANDPLNLLAVDGPTNGVKSDSDASEWLPPNVAYRCSYVARQIGIKARYGLWVTPAEGSAMRQVLSRCPGQMALGV
jgi:hypothetical protein